MNEHEKIFIDYLKRSDLKYTRPRQIILNIVFNNPSHFDVETLYDQIRRNNRDVSRATVYRTMPLLVKSGLIKQSLRCQAKDQYENVSDQDHHLHLVCNNCGKIIEINSSELENRLRSLAEVHKFKILDFSIGAQGLCRKCSNKRDKETKS